MGKENKLTKKERDEIVSEAKSSLWEDIFCYLAILVLGFCFFYTMASMIGFNGPSGDEHERFCEDLNEIKLELVTFEREYPFRDVTDESQKLLDMYSEYCIWERY